MIRLVPQWWYTLNIITFFRRNWGFLVLTARRMVIVVAIRTFSKDVDSSLSMNSSIHQKEVHNSIRTNKEQSVPYYFIASSWNIT
jgi:hypothetical protein